MKLRTIWYAADYINIVWGGNYLPIVGRRIINGRLHVCILYTV